MGFRQNICRYLHKGEVLLICFHYWMLHIKLIVLGWEKLFQSSFLFFSLQFQWNCRYYLFMIQEEWNKWWEAAWVTGRVFAYQHLHNSLSVNNRLSRRKDAWSWYHTVSVTLTSCKSTLAHHASVTCWSLFCFLSKCSFLPRGLCICCFVFLECSSLGFFWTSFSSQFKWHS